MDNSIKKYFTKEDKARESLLMRLFIGAMFMNLMICVLLIYTTITR